MHDTGGAEVVPRVALLGTIPAPSLRRVKGAAGLPVPWAAVLRILLTVLICAAGTPGAVAGSSPVAVVDGVGLEGWELDRELAMRISTGSYHRNLSEDRTRELRCQSLKSLIIKELKRQWAESNAVEVDSEVLEASWQEVRNRFTSDKQYRTALETKGISDAGLRRALRRDAVAQAADAVMFSKIAEPTETEIEVFFILHREEYMTPEARRVVHALVYVPPSATREEWQRAEVRAADLSAGVSGGEITLLDAAQSLLEELPPTLRDQVGDIGFVHRGSLQAAIDEAVFGAEPGSVTGPIMTIYGFHVMQVIATRPPQPLDLADVRAAVAGRMKAEQRHRAMEGFEDQLLEESEIEVGECSDGF